MVRNYKRKTEDRWTKENLLEALCSIKDAQIKINEAAKQYGISIPTLYRQYQKFMMAGGKLDVNQFRTCGGNPILTKVEEDIMETKIADLRRQGFVVTGGDIKRICFEYCLANGIFNQFNPTKRMASDDWYFGFLKRHPNLKTTAPVKEKSPGPSKNLGVAAAIVQESLKSFEENHENAGSEQLPVFSKPSIIIKMDATGKAAVISTLGITEIVKIDKTDLSACDEKMVDADDDDRDEGEGAHVEDGEMNEGEDDDDEEMADDNDEEEELADDIDEAEELSDDDEEWTEEMTDDKS